MDKEALELKDKKLFCTTKHGCKVYGVYYKN